MAKSKKQLRSDALDALEAKRCRLEAEYNALRDHNTSLTNTEMARRDDLRRALDEMNSKIVSVIIDEGR